jgi:hypothetical protein
MRRAAVRDVTGAAGYVQIRVSTLVYACGDGGCARKWARAASESPGSEYFWGTGIAGRDNEVDKGWSTPGRFAGTAALRSS